MIRAGARVDRGFRWGFACLATVVAVAAISNDAHARGRRHAHRAAAVESYQPSTASIVFDANSGAVMQESNADSQRHPASLTKNITLSLLLERLGAGIQGPFPTYYRYFATRIFEFRGNSMRNHNHLLGTVDGVDGIKTGYIHDSGFNIVTSVRRDGRHLIAVVFGGRTASARDARVLSLINNNINIAAAKRSAPPLLEGWETAETRARTNKSEQITAAAPAVARTAASPVSQMVAIPATRDAAPTTTPVTEIMAPTAVADNAPAPGSSEPIKPNTVKTVTVHPATMQTAALSPLPSDSQKLTPA